MAYDYAQKNHKGKVSIITKANIIKTTDGKFLKTAQMIGQEYPEIVTDDWYVDITTAKLIDPMRRKDFKVFVLPNLYGDIITDEAAEFQGASALPVLQTSVRNTPCLRPFTLRTPHDQRGPRPVCRPLLHAACHRYAAVPHWVPKAGGRSGGCAGQVHV